MVGSRLVFLEVGMHAWIDVASSCVAGFFTTLPHRRGFTWKDEAPTMFAMRPRQCLVSYAYVVVPQNNRAPGFGSLGGVGTRGGA
jgi:hypothetical protein